ncbi:MAG: response regulator [Verrucomicrobiota bacterium]
MKKRILFVDDDPVLLQFYTAFMQSEKDRWEITTLDQAVKALDLLAHEHFDVLVSDFRMPGIDGLQFMREVSQKFPRAARFTISGIQDREQLAQCLGATHQFLPKPFDFKQFKAALGRVGELHGFLENPQLQSIVSKLGTLPSFPSLYLQMMAEVNNKNRSLETLAGIVAKDPAMTAKLLQIVNSATFGRARKMSTPFEAIHYLGVNAVHSLVLSAHVFASCEASPPLPGVSMQALWNHAVQTALLSRLILQTEGVELEEAEAAYTAGLLHDIGKLMLLQNLRKEFEAALTLAANEGIPLFQAETRVLGASHAAIGAYLLGLWGLPAEIVEAVAFHHTPALSGLRMLGPLAAVHVANSLLQNAQVHAPGISVLDLEYLAGLGIADHLDRWRGMADKFTADLA